MTADSTAHRMDRSAQQQVRDLLKQGNRSELLDLCESDRRFWKALRLSLHESDDDLRWPAVEAVAELMQRWWLAGQEGRVREFVRKLIWSLNDESGGIGWNSPQAIAEMIFRIPELLEPYGSMMISRALEEPPLVKSGLWAIGRLGGLAEQALGLHQDVVLATFRGGDPETLGLAAWAMGEVRFPQALPYLRQVENRTEPVRIYIEGQFCAKSLGQWVNESIAKINRQAATRS